MADDAITTAANPAVTHVKSRKPANTAFKQQRLRAWQPILTPRTVLPTFFIIGLIFIPLGIGLYYVSNSVVELAFDYTNCRQLASKTLSSDSVPAGILQWAFDDATNLCTVVFQVTQMMNPPVFIYYRLSNFYQNHRRYVKSVSTDQLLGTLAPSTLDQDCDPLAYDPSGLVYYPCGLIANSMFNDTIGQVLDASFVTFALLNKDNSLNYVFTSNGIAWPEDRIKYGSLNSNDTAHISPPRDWIGGNYRGFNVSSTWAATGTLFDPTVDEHFQVWMRTAGLPTFRKLYGRNSTAAMIPGTYQIQIEDNFPVQGFSATKSIVLSTTSWLGGKNNFLGVAYMTVGCLCIALGVIFLLKHYLSPRKLGDHTYLSWNQPSVAAAAANHAGPSES